MRRNGDFPWCRKRADPPPLILSFVLLALAAFPGCTRDPSGSPTARATASARSPHVLVYLIDTLRADRLGLYGYGRNTSPNIDRLAMESVVFDHAYGPAPWTLPSVVSLMTSTFVCEHGVVVDGQKIPKSLPPLAERLARVGYATASFYSNSYSGPMSGLDRGFSHSEYFSLKADSAVERWLDRNERGPVFLYIHTVEPHDPYVAPKSIGSPFGEVPAETRKLVHETLDRYRRLARVDWTRKIKLGTTDNTQLQLAAMSRLAQLEDSIGVLYDGDVRLADRNLGRMVGQLKARGLWDDTLFILVADHGEELGERGGWEHDQSVYEELAHVPMVIHFPQQQFAGVRVGDAVSLVDALPTIFDYIGHPELTSPSRGRSMMPLIRGDAAQGQSSLVIPSMRLNKKKFFRPYKEKRGDLNLVIRQGAWKGIWNVEPHSFELFDLSRDPEERTDVSAQYAERVQAMREHAEAWLERCRSGGAETNGRPVEPLDAETRERLRALGYVD